MASEHDCQGLGYVCGELSYLMKRVESPQGLERKLRGSGNKSNSHESDRRAVRKRKFIGQGTGGSSHHIYPGK